MRWLSRVPGQVWVVAVVGLLSLGGGVYLGEAFRTPVRHLLFNVFGVGQPAAVPPKLGAVPDAGGTDAPPANKTAEATDAVQNNTGEGAGEGASSASASDAAGSANTSAVDNGAAASDGKPQGQDGAQLATGSSDQGNGALAESPPPLDPQAPQSGFPSWAMVPGQAPPPGQTPPAAPGPLAIDPAPAASTPAADLNAAQGTPTPGPTAGPTAGPAVGQAFEPGAAAAAPMTGALADWMAMPVTIRVKVFVDDLYARAHPDWLSQAQRTVALASAALRLIARVDLELIGVVRFAEPLDGLTLPALLSTIKHRPLDGADVAVAFVDHALPDNACGGGDVGSMHNGSYGAVGPDLADGYLGGLLRCLGQMLGAQLVTDPQSQAYRLGSFMRPELMVSGKHAPWLDPENRARIMQRKGLPFGQAAVGGGGKEVK